MTGVETEEVQPWFLHQSAFKSLQPSLLCAIREYAECTVCAQCVCVYTSMSDVGPIRQVGGADGEGAAQDELTAVNVTPASALIYPNCGGVCE